MASVAEGNGAMGDLGTFLPLLVGLSVTQGLDAGTTLIYAGVYNVLCGFWFEIPMPLQPMKTIATVALSESKDQSVHCTAQITQSFRLQNHWICNS